MLSFLSEKTGFLKFISDPSCLRLHQTLRGKAKTMEPFPSYVVFFWGNGGYKPLRGSLEFHSTTLALEPLTYAHYTFLSDADQEQRISET